MHEKNEKVLRNCAESIAKDENTHSAPKHNAKRRSVSGQLWEEQPKAFEQALPAQVSLKQPQAHKATTRRANSETSIPLRSRRGYFWAESSLPCLGHDKPSHEVERVAIWLKVNELASEASLVGYSS